MHVHGQLDDFVVQSYDDLHQCRMALRTCHTCEDVSCYLINQSLNSSSSVDVQRDVNQPRQNLVDHDLQHLWISSFDNLLAKIVSKLISHDLGKNWQHKVYEACVKDAILAVSGMAIITSFVSWLQFRLQHSATSLIKAIEVEPA